MPNMSMTRVPMPHQEPDVRRRNFLEVALGFTPEMAMEEASRCLNCKTRPCVSGCPVNVNIPDFLMHVSKGEFEEAYQVITRTNGLPAVCGRVCPQETQCEGKCVRGIKGDSVSIGRLERFCADYHMKNVSTLPEKPQSNGKKVAIPFPERYNLSIKVNSFKNSTSFIPVFDKLSSTIFSKDAI